MIVRTPTGVIHEPIPTRELPAEVARLWGYVEEALSSRTADPRTVLESVAASLAEMSQTGDTP